MIPIASREANAIRAETGAPPGTPVPRALAERRDLVRTAREVLERVRRTALTQGDLLRVSAGIFSTLTQSIPRVRFFTREDVFSRGFFIVSPAALDITSIGHPHIDVTSMRGCACTQAVRHFHYTVTTEWPVRASQLEVPAGVSVTAIMTSTAMCDEYIRNQATGAWYEWIHPRDVRREYYDYYYAGYRHNAASDVRRTNSYINRGTLRMLTRARRHSLVLSDSSGGDEDWASEHRLVFSPFTGTFNGDPEAPNAVVRAYVDGDTLRRMEAAMAGLTWVRRLIVVSLGERERGEDDGEDDFLG